MAEEFGTESCYNTVNTEHNAVAMLDSTHVVVAYKDTGGSGYGYAKVGVIAGNTVTWGVENVFNSAITNHISIDTLDNTHFVISYQNSGSSNRGSAIVGLVSGTTISSYGAENVYNASATTGVSVSAIDSSHFVTVYRDFGNLGYGTARIGVVSGTTISSYGATNVYNSATSDNNEVRILDSTHFVVTYIDAGGSSYGCARIGLISGTTISSYGTENIFNSAVTADPNLSVLDSTHFVVVYRDTGSSGYGTAIVGLVSGVTISSYGAESVYHSASSNYVGVSRLDDTHFVVLYTKASDGYGCARQGTVSGTTISSYDTEVTVNSAITNNIGIIAINSTDYIVVYRDDGGNDYGCAQIWGTTLSKQFTTESCFNTVNTEYTAVAMLDENHVVVAYTDTGGAGYGCAKVGVIAENTVTWGAELCFNSTLTKYISIAALDSTHFVVTYQDDGGADYGCARIGLVLGTTISSYGSENVFNSSVTYYPSVSALDSTHFVVVYRDDGNGQRGTAIIGLVSGTTISSYGAENIFNSGTSNYTSVSALDSTHFVVAYRDIGNSSYGTAIVGLVSGTTISSYGAENVFNSASTDQTSVSALDSTHFVVVYHDVGNSYYGTATVGLVSGTTISSYGAENVFNSDVTYYQSVSVLDSTHFIVVYSDINNSSYGTAIVGVISGTTISSYGTENVFNSVATSDMVTVALSSTDYVVVYRDGGGDDYGCARVWQTLDESAFGTESCFNTVNTEYNAVAMLDSTHVVVAYKDTGGAGYGCAKVGVISGNTVTWGAESVFYSNNISHMSVAALDSTHFVIAYYRVDAVYSSAIVGSISGTTITLGTQNSFNAGAVSSIDVATLDSTHFVAVYDDGANSDHGTAIVGLTDGATTISSYGAENVFNAAATDYISVSTFNSTHFVVTYMDDGGADYGCAIIGSVSGTTISSYGAENVFNSAVTNYTAVVTLDSTHFVVTYEDVGNSYYGTAIVGLTDGATTISSYGAENVFNSAQVVYNSIDKLDNTHFVISYVDIGNLWYGTTVIGTVSGTTISDYGTENAFNSASTDSIGVTALNSTDYVVVYRDNGGADYGCARVWGTESGWSGIIIGVSSPARVMGVEVTNITSVIGIS